MDSEAFLIRGLGHRAEEIAARFFGRLGSTGIEGVKRSSGRLEMDVGDGKKDSRDYYFAERELGDEALATMAVRVAATGADLFVEWRHYTTPPVGPIRREFGEVMALLMGLPFFGTPLGAVAGLALGSGTTPDSFIAGAKLGFAIGLVGAIILLVVPFCGRQPALEGFQNQESMAFQGSVRGALKEALYEVGVREQEMQALSKDGERRRVI